MVYHKGFKKSGTRQRLHTILQIDKTTDYFKKQKKAIAEKLSAAAFFLSWWSPKAVLIIILILFLPYIITMCSRGVSNAGAVRQQIYEYKDCPVLEIEDSHGTLYLPIEIYLKGVLGGHIYVNSMETKSKYREKGELIILDNDSLFIEKGYKTAVSGNGAVTYQINETQLKELAIRYRSQIYYKYSGEKADNKLRAERNPEENNHSVAEGNSSYYYFTDTELKQLFDDNWDLVEEQILNCIKDTWGKVYGKDGEVVYVMLDGEVKNQLYSAW